MRGKVVRYVTLALIPHSGEGPRALRVPRRILPVLAGAPLGLLLLFLWASSAYLDTAALIAGLKVRLVRQEEAYRALEQAYVDSQARVAVLSAEAARIDGLLQRLTQESRELQELLARADSAPPPRPQARPGGRQPPSALGQGGPAEPVDPLMVVALALRDADLQALAHARHLQELRASTVEFVRRRAHTPTIWPADGWLSSTFGIRRHPVTGQMEFHDGVDIAGRMGSPVVAAADGRVVMAGRRSGYGVAVIVDHGYGVRTLYGHLASFRVRPGQAVTKGQIIGAMGNTGLSTGPHLHYEVHVNGRPVDPLRYLPGR